MLLGSSLVSDCDGVNDIDIVYVTYASIGKLILLTKYRKLIEIELSKKLGKDVTIAPYVVLNPLAMGNLSIKINSLRVLGSKRGKAMSKGSVLTLYKLSRKVSRRWYLLHAIFAYLGLLCAKSNRDKLKYGSMLSENILAINDLMIPTSWRKTILYGIALTYKLGLRNNYELLRTILRNGYVSLKLISEGLKEYINLTSNRKYINENIIEIFNKLITSRTDAFRILHERIYKLVTDSSLHWTECIRLLVLIVVNLMKAKLQKKLLGRICSAYNMCKKNIPTFSPLATP